VCLVGCSLLRILGRCEVELYRQMGGHRDELSLHERSLDVLVGLLKEEMVRDLFFASYNYACCLLCLVR